MYKLISLLVMLPSLAFAVSKHEMAHAMCKDLHINASTTLQEIKDNCRIAKQQIGSNGVFEVTINNDATNSELVCSFPDKKPTAILSSCK